MVITLGTFNGANGLVPDIPAGNIPIALIEVTAGTDPNKTDYRFQLYTLDKKTNSLSIGYSSGSPAYYTEAGGITGTSAGLFISGIGTATVAGADKVLIQDAGSSDVIKSVTASSIAALAPQGDITGITAGTGLTGTNLTGPVPTLNVGGLTVAELAASSVLVAGETFADNDTNLMTAAAINDRIESFGYTTNVGDITGVALTAGTGIDLTSVANATAGDYAATIGVDVSDFMTNGANDRVLTATGTDGINAEADLTVGSGVIGINKSLVLSVAGATDFEPTVVNAIIDKSNNASPTANNVINLPTAASVATRVFRLKNINANTVLTINTANSNEKFEHNIASTDTRWNSVTQIELKPLETILLQAVTDGVTVPLAGANYAITPGYLILDTVPKEIGDIESVVAGTGLTGGATSGAATLNVIGGTGITANANDIAITAGGVGATQLADEGVTYAKMQHVSATSRVLGRISSGTGDVEELTAANLRTILTVADGSLSQNSFTDADHTKLNNITASAVNAAGAITAVEGEATLLLAGQVNLRADIEVCTSDPAPTIAESGCIFQFTKGSAGVFTLPANPTVGVQYVLVNGDGQDIVITPQSGDKINGATANKTNTTAYAATSIVCAVGGGSAEWLAFGGI